MIRFAVVALIGAGLWLFNALIAHSLQDFAYELHILLLIGINALMAVSLNLINGVTGQFSMGHAGFMAIGGYVSAAITFFLEPALAAYPLSALLPPGLLQSALFVLSLVAGGLAAAGAGLIVGLPALRLRGDYLAMATLGFGEIIRVIILNIEAVGGARGFTGIAERANFFWIYAILIVATWLLVNLVRSSKGKAFFAVREDEIAAASIGISTTRFKLMAFTIGAFFAGVGGGLFAHTITYLHTNTFSFMKSFEYIVMVVLGGMGSFMGAIIAAAALTVLPELLRAAQEYRMVIYSLLLVVIMIVRVRREAHPR